MSLSGMWKDSRQFIEDKHVQQVITFAGDGHLRDESATCQEFRAFLSMVPSGHLERYSNECLLSAFKDSGLVLQDIINQVGRRLGFEITYGRYRGTSGQIGHDGLWKSLDGHHIVLEVKTTDAFSINLNTVAGYRKALLKDGLISENESSILIVVGRQDTGDLEAQIRGSRHAWDIRVISADALIRLMYLKQDVEDPKIIKRIHDILIPREFTRLDEIVEILFSTAEEIKEVEVEAEIVDEASHADTEGPKFHPVSFHDLCIDKIEKYLNKPLIKKSRASFISSDNTTALVCLVSKEHSKGPVPHYWYSFHPYQKEYLEEAEKGFVALGCGSQDKILIIPIEKFATWLPEMNTTDTETKFYWHVHIEDEGGKMILKLKQGVGHKDITEYLISIT